MRVLWCTHSLAGFKPEIGGYNGCGWITSLMTEFKNCPNVQIGIAFYYGETIDFVEKDDVTYFPIEQGHIGIVDKLKSYFGYSNGWIKEEQKHINRLKEVVKRFEPDIIHVWGTETDMGLIAGETNVPVILHLQGLLSPIENSLLPPGISKNDYVSQNGWNPWKKLVLYNSLYYWKYKAEREVRILRKCRNYFGRTHFDKAISEFFSGGCNYYYCSEILREPFYCGVKWTKPERKEIVIMSTISSPLYKGADLILRTANILSKYSKVCFRWNLIGVTNLEYIEKKIGIKAKDVKVHCVGVKTAEEIKDMILDSNLYFHTSYIDNSPNSVCEAQMLGLPVMVTDVGGVTSLVKHGETGFVVPSNEPHISASLIKQICQDELSIDYISNKSVETATLRHDKTIVVESLLKGYESVIKYR